MAKKTADSPEQAKGSSALAMIVTGVLLTVITGGAGFLAGGQLRKSASATTAVPPPLEAAKVEKMPSAQVVPLPPIVANLAGEKGNWVRIEVTLVLNDDKPLSPSLVSELSTDILGLMRTQTLPQIGTATGFQYLREELLERAKTRSGGRARQLTIQSMVIE